jgi:hypothetical protein
MRAGTANGDLGQSLTAVVVLRTRFCFVAQEDLVSCTAGEEQDQFRGRAGGDLGADAHSGVGIGTTAGECTLWHVQRGMRQQPEGL